jgi:energy-coupling factor transport system ATP-binding protein
MLKVAELIKKLAEKGKTILIATHDPELVSYTCNHICFLKSGKLEFIKKVEECKTWLGDYFSLCI